LSNGAAPGAAGSAVAGAGGGSPDGSATDGAATGGAASTTCPLPTEANTLMQVQAAKAQPPWVEVGVTILFQDPGFDFSQLATASGDARAMLLAERQAELAPIESDLEERLLAIGARQIGLDPFTADVNAVVPAGRLPEIPCWPNVTAIDGGALLCLASPCVDPCFACATCDGACAPLVADRLDLGRGCVEHGVPMACAGSYTVEAGSDELTCYTRKDTDEVFVVRTPWLVDAGNTMFRKCSPAEGGATPPGSLPACPGAPGTAGAPGATGAAGTGGIAGGPGTCRSGLVPPSEGWVDRTPAVLPESWPSPRRAFALVADDNAQRVDLYGGYASGLPTLDTWDWNGSSGVWTKHPASPPEVFDAMAVAYDQRRNQVVIFGGETFPNAAPSNAIWQWGFGDQTWTSPIPIAGAILPSSRLYATAVYDYALDHVIVQGGQGHESELWEWTVGANTWTNRSAPVGQSPVGPSAFAWDAGRRVGILFGGAKGNELWQWDEASGGWTQVAAAPGLSWPPPRQFAGLTLDRDSGIMILFGGRSPATGNALNDLWEWNPDFGWKLLDDGTGPNAPPPRYMFGMTYDPSIGRTVILGGAGDTGDLADVWTHQSSI
jgi:Galactose oxidase, central domain